AQEALWTASTIAHDARPARRADEPRTPVVDRYALQRRIGGGGFGTVYLAHDQELDRLVAIKVPHDLHRIRPEQLHSYRTEARLHAGLDHPNIVPIYDVGGTDLVPFYLVSKFIGGQDLTERIKKDRPGFAAAAGLLIPLAEALQHMHDRGMFHRDVKPRNIVLDAEGTPYLTDFGL